MKTKLVIRRKVESETETQQLTLAGWVLRYFTAGFFLMEKRVYA